jgi:hypothetical protein
MTPDPITREPFFQKYDDREDGTYTCRRCGAVVSGPYIETHDAFHASLLPAGDGRVT